MATVRTLRFARPTVSHLFHSFPTLAPRLPFPLRPFAEQSALRRRGARASFAGSSE
jgi:hypothetical protein